MTTGGPATSVQWTWNGVPVGSGGDFTTSQIIVDTQTSTYSNQLTVSGKHLGMYRVSISNSRQPSPVQSYYHVTGEFTLRLILLLLADTIHDITEEAPPTDFSISLVSDDGILVSWTPAASVSNLTVYIIYYEAMNVSRQVSVSGMANSHTLRGLEFGSTYSVSIAARSDFQSPLIGPKEITIGTVANNNF